MANKEEAENEEYERLKNSKFKQQKLPGWRPVPTITSTTIIFCCFGVVFIVLGIVILVFSNKIEEVSFRYDDFCKGKPDPCPITIKIKNKMEKKVMVYYKLDGFYQNHRRYVKSKSDDQLNGKFISLKDMKDSGDCDPAITNKDMGQTHSYLTDSNGDPLHLLVPDDVAIPCGLLAKSYFNDKFNSWQYKGPNDISAQNLVVNDNNIAWKADKELKYKNVDPAKQWINMEDEHFIVWMRPAGLPNFRKLWGRIDQQDLEAGSEVSLTIENKFDVSSFNGKKYIILTTVNAFGGKNTFLAVCYIVLGCISIVLAIAFVIGYNIYSKKNK